MLVKWTIKQSKEGDYRGNTPAPKHDIVEDTPNGVTIASRLEFSTATYLVANHNKLIDIILELKGTWI